jgi:archaeal chaperonin
MEQIISPHYQRLNGKEAWRQNLHIIIYAADKIRSTLGPKGAYKLVTYNKGPEQVVKVTKDAIAVLDELAIQYPPAIIVAESAKMQRQEAGDGTASFVVFLSALLKKADELLNMKIHPNTIVHGYYLATEHTLELLEKQATAEPESFDILDTVDCKRNLLTSNIRSIIKQVYPFAFIDERFDINNIRFLRRNGGGVDESVLIRGVVVKKAKAHPNMPDTLKNLRIALISKRLGFDRLELKMPKEGPTPIRLNIKSADQLRQYHEEEIRLKTTSMQKLADLNVNVLLCQQPIEDYQKSLLVKMGVFALERVSQEDFTAIANASGAKVIADLKELTDEDVGFADQLSADRIELENIVTFSGCKSATILLRGNVPQAIDELETVIKNSLTTLKILDDDRRILPGGGATEVQLAEQLHSYAKSLSGREQVVVDAYASALMDIPRCLAENYGLNVTDSVLELRNRHDQAENSVGICEEGCQSWVSIEPLKVKRSIIRRACEVSLLMLRIDELLISKEIPKFHKK